VALLDSEQLAQAVLWALVLVAATWDVWQRRIPNALILTGLLLGLAFGVQSSGLPGAALAVAGAAVGLLALLPLFYFRVMGGGDVKLAMVCGAFTGWEMVIQIILIGTVVHGIIALLWLFARRLARARGRDLDDSAKIPHAVGFAVATVITTAGIYTIW